MRLPFAVCWHSPRYISSYRTVHYILWWTSLWRVPTLSNLLFLWTRGKTVLVATTPLLHVGEHTFPVQDTFCLLPLPLSGVTVGMAGGGGGRCALVGGRGNAQASLSASIPAITWNAGDVLRRRQQPRLARRHAASGGVAQFPNPASHRASHLSRRINSIGQMWLVGRWHVAARTVP